MTDWYYDNFGALLGEIERALQAFVSDRPQVARLFWQMVDHHFGWRRDDLGHISGGDTVGGKRIRPLLLLLVAEALTGEHERAMPAGVAIELVHNFTLAHDDVMDRSLQRRHRQTLWARWGTAQAINAGDGLYALGLSSLLGLAERGVSAERTLRAMDALLAACLATVEGQMLDVGFEKRLDVTPDEYLVMIAGKSGALIECSTRIGALLSTGDERIIEAYAEFGRSLGIAFQVWDDYLGIWGRTENTGKSATSDIESRKKSYPVLTAFQRADPRQCETLTAIYQQEQLAPAEITTVLEILDTVNAAGETQRLIDVYFERALQALDSVGIENTAQRRLRELALFLVERAY